MYKNYYVAALVMLVMVMSSCSQSSGLMNHSLDGKDVAVVAEVPDAPFADFDMTIFDRVGQDVPLANQPPESRRLPPSLVIGEVNKDEDDTPKPVTSVHRLIDSVLVDFDMSSQIVDATHQRGASLMHYEQSDDEAAADYLLKANCR